MKKTSYEHAPTTHRSTQSAPQPITTTTTTTTKTLRKSSSSNRGRVYALPFRPGSKTGSKRTSLSLSKVGSSREKRVPSSSSSSKSRRTPASSRGYTNSSRRRSRGQQANAQSNSNIASVSLNRKHNEVGIAFIDLGDQSRISISQIPDNAFYSNTLSLLQGHHTSIVLLPDTATKTRLCEMITQVLGEDSVVPVNRKYFNESNGLELLQKHAANSMETDVAQKYLCLSAFATLMCWTEHTKHILFAPKSILVQWEDVRGSLMIDHASARHLELLHNSRTGKDTNGSLFASMNFTRTSVGKRMLRSRLLCPPNKIDVVNARLNSLEELLSSEEIFFQTQRCLKQFSDLDSMVSQLSSTPKDFNVKAARTSVRNLLALKHTLELAPKLSKILKSAKTSVLVEARQSCESRVLGKIRDTISRVIRDDTSWTKSTVSMLQQTVLAFRTGIDADLDIARMTYTKIIASLTEYSENLMLELGYNLNLSYTTRRGYIFETHCSKEHEVPISGGIALRAVRNGKKIRWTTTKLLAINNRINECTRLVFERLKPPLAGLRVELREYIGVLFTLVNAIGNLDVCMSFAELVTSSELESYSRPKLHQDKSSAMMIEEGRHPVIEETCVKQGATYTPSNVVMGSGTNVVMITGANGSGKSTFMKQIAVINIMAHVGCFVPAKFANIRLCDRIFTRIGVEDDMEANASTFFTEMKETNFILENCTERCLIFMDELGRGTSHRSGLSLAWSVCEFLALSRPNAHVFSATHYTQLTSLTKLYPIRIKNVHLQIETDSDPSDSKIQTTRHVVENGAMTNAKDYGIRTAIECGFPERTIEIARRVRDEVEPKLSKSLSVSSLSSGLLNGSSNRISDVHCVKLLRRLLLLKQSTAADNKLLIRQYLERLRKKYVRSGGCDDNADILKAGDALLKK